MAVRFAIEPETINDQTDGHAAKAQVGLLLHIWEHYGILVHPHPKISQGFKSQNHRKQWEVIFQKAHKENIPMDFLDGDIDWDGMKTVSALEAYFGKFDVAVLEEARALEFNIPEDKGRIFGEIECIRLSDFPSSTKIKDAIEAIKDAKEQNQAYITSLDLENRRLELENKRLNARKQAEDHAHFLVRASQDQKYLKRGDSIGDIWSEHFRIFAECASEIYIFDRYAMDIDGDNIRGMITLLRLINECANGCKVVIYSSVKGTSEDDFRIQKAEKGNLVRKRLGDYRADSLKNDKLTNIDVYLFSDEHFRDYGHDRHMRFDNYSFSIGTGGAVFNNEKVLADTQFELAVLRHGQKHIRELRLKDNPHIRPYHIEI